MAFMIPEYMQDTMVHIETSHDSPTVDRGAALDVFKEFLYGQGGPTSLEAETQSGWYFRLSAPGYMDCTEWSGPYDTLAAAKEGFSEIHPETCNECGNDLPDPCEADWKHYQCPDCFTSEV